MRNKSLTRAALTVVAILTLSACGNGMDMSDSDMAGMDDSSPSSTSSSDAAADFNDADVAFATNMIPHHKQALEMAELAETRAKSQKVKDLAAQIKNAQGPEIETMTGWLTAWGQPIPEDMSGMDMSGSMPGMMTMDEMQDLENASGAEFDQMFLTMMIKHHQGAIAMAKTEQTDGTNEAAIQLAEKIEEAQTSEIATIKDLLN